jgi:hypothetical protein
MSDLQCPANILLVAREMLGPGAGVSVLEGMHYSEVFVVSALAAEAGELAQYRPEIIADVVDGASLARALENLADLYRGYTVVVVATREMICDLFGERASDPRKPIALAIDSSGWTVFEALATRP